MSTAAAAHINALPDLVPRQHRVVMPVWSGERTVEVKVVEEATVEVQRRERGDAEASVHVWKCLR